MNKKSIVIEGNFVEAYLYFDHLWLISAHGETWAFDISLYLSESDPSTFEVARAVFANNDQLAPGQQFFSYDHLGQPTRDYLDTGDLHITSAELEQYSVIFDTRISARSVMDMRCYYGRAFVATENQVIQLRVLNRADLDHVGRGFRANGQLGGWKVHEARCLQFRCGFGALNISCGDDGGLYSTGASSDDVNWRPAFKSFAGKSTASEYIAERLVSVGGDLKVDLFHSLMKARGSASPEEMLGEEEKAEKELIGLERDQGDEVDAIYKSMDEIAGDKEWQPRRVFFSKSKIWLCGPKGQLASVNVAERSQWINPTASTRMPGLDSTVLRISTSGAGLLAELDESAVLYADRRWQTIFDGAVYSVRGYPQSKRYTKMITAVGEDRAQLTFVA
ncbi:MAG: hypothetical protein IR164_07625 [Devosia sp.]|uniref:hypothetical protein n=1 Tax=Devosia sp. TaxID=1871048 RepID=UPI0019EE3530|nr:hypothetical protein [Devosia sp.]MBF0678791.1 hypothetical protein [Devosia sp.]